ncbi:MAG TPA: hypothetical protein VNO30_28125 [Kofleriaceae bacterium]|nr:hypothetical protein [Kofleriaceae bacterium]
MAQGADSDYRCVATMEVPADQVERYDQLICQAASVFKAHDWRLLVPAQKTDVFDTTGQPPGLVRKLLHVWSIPSFNTLPEVMAYAADNESYVEAQALTMGEAQNLYTVLRWDSPIGLPSTPVNSYMLETLHMINRVQAREDFATYMDNAVYKMNSSYGWKILFAGNATTGTINEYVNVWGMAETSTLEAAIAEYRGGAAWAAAVSRVSTSLWSQRPLPCFDTLNAPAAESAAADKTK